MNISSGTQQPAKGRNAVRIALLLILLLSCFIRFTVVSGTVVDSPIRADARTYFSCAYNLKNFGIYSAAATWAESGTAKAPVPDSLVTPGYPLFLLAVGNPEPTLEYVSRVTQVQAFLGVLSVWLMYLISARFLRPRWALTAALLTALSPHLAIMSAYLLTESLFIFLLFASIYSLLVALESRRRAHMVLTGVLWGLTSLVRPTAQFFPIIMLLAVFMVPKLRQYSALASVAFACFLAVQAPWQIRNRMIPETPGQPSLMVNFLNFGAYPNFMYEGLPESYAMPYRYDPDIAEIQKDLPSFFSSIAGKFRDKPLEYTRWYLIGKPGYFLSWTNIDGVGDIYVYPVLHSPYFEDRRFEVIRLLMLLLHWPLMFLGLLGALVACLRPKWAGLDPSMRMAAMTLAALIAYALAFHMVGAPLPRYGIPFRPLLYPMALLLLSSFWQARQGRRDSHKNGLQQAT